MREWDEDQVEWIDAARRLGRLFAVQGAGRAYQGGFGHGGGLTPEESTYSAHVRHVDGGRSYDVEVDGETGWPAEMDTWRLLTDWLHGAVSAPDEITFPFEVRADRWSASIDVDGTPHEFLVIGGPERWCAAAQVGDRAVRLRGSGPGSLPVALVGVAPEDVSDDLPEDPEP
ncbi:MAG: hypothetical protein JWM64_1442 [Frankiales bacterium]|nr:hypothetical protein [Frankiales bacterium]